LIAWLLVINATLKVYSSFGVMFMAYHFRVNASQIKIGGGVFAAASNYYFSVARFAQQGLHYRLNGQ